MSKYTTQLRWIVEQSEMGAKVQTAGQYHQETYKKLGLDAYPIFDELYRTTLNDKIINHFYFREIGFETVALFAWYMRQTMWEQMPYFNQLYESLGLVTDPMKSFSRDKEETWDVANEEEWTDKRNGSTEATASTDSRNVYQDTPMSMLETNPSAVERLQYATNVTYDEGKTDSASSTSNDGMGDRGGTETGNRTVKESWYDIPQADLLMKYRATFINVDMQVISELEDLFMGLW